MLEQAAGEDCERSIRGDIQFATECTVVVPLPRSSPLPRPPAHPAVSHHYDITVTIIGCALAAPVPRSAHLTHLLSQPIPSAHIDLRKKTHTQMTLFIYPHHPT